ncbi:MAG TPA: hypothetical protein VGI92_12300 [Gemmatimonadales bacterium]
MHRSTLLAALVVGIAPALSAQQPAAPPAAAAPQPLEVGAVAPDFTLPASTRYGLLREPVHLSDFRGKTVVLAFFFKSRTRG